MAKLIYSAITSLDGYTVDAQGSFDWAFPGEEVHRDVNDRQRPVGSYLYGRRMYEVMQAWETMGTAAADPAVIRDFGELWRAADKVVYSSTLTAVSSARTRIEPDFDPERVRELVESAQADVTIGGPMLAAKALAAGLVDEIQQYLCPVIVGGGTKVLPDGVHLDLELTRQKTFENGFVLVGYRVKR